MLTKNMTAVLSCLLPENWNRVGKKFIFCPIFDKKSQNFENFSKNSCLKTWTEQFGNTKDKVIKIKSITLLLPIFKNVNKGDENLIKDTENVNKNTKKLSTIYKT